MYWVACALLIGTGVAWMARTASLAHFLVIFGDCAPEKCEGYFGTWATTARFSELIVPLGYAVFGVAVAAVFFRVAQIALLVVSLAMIGTVVLGLVVGAGDFWLPGPDVWLSQFGTVFAIQLPAAVFWLAGAALGLLIPRTTSAPNSSTMP